MNPVGPLLRFVRWWVAFYTRGLPHGVTERRRGEMESDLCDHAAHDRERGRPPTVTALEMLARLVRGAPADLIWRTNVRARSTGQSTVSLVGGIVIRTMKTPLVSLGLTAVILAIVHLMVTLAFRTPDAGAHPVAVAIWVAFGSLLTIASRALPRRTLLLSGTLLAIIGLLGLAGTGWTPVPTSWASTYFTWIPVGLLLTHGLWGVSPVSQPLAEPNSRERP